MPKIAANLSQLGTETAFEVLARAGRLAAQGKDIINLGIGQPDFKTPPHIVEAAIKAMRDGHHGYTPANGIPALREAVAADIAKYRNVEIDPDCVMIMPGGKPTMFFSILMFGEPGTEILYPNPGFPIYESMIRYVGAEPVPIELHESAGFAFDPDQVLSKVNDRTRLVIVNTPGNPTGGVIERDALDAFVKGIERFPDVVILADEIYSRLLYDGLEHVSLLSYPSIRDRTILLDGWSKTWSMTGWRLGYGVWPKELVDHAERLQINSNSCPSAGVQVAGIEALLGPQDDADKMHATFDERRKLMVAGLNEIPGFSCVMPKGAFYAFPNITKTGMKAKELETFLLDEVGIATVAGTSFGHLGEGYIRFSYAASTEDITEALRRTKEAMAARLASAS